MPDGADGVVIGHDMRPARPSCRPAFAAGVTAATASTSPLIGLCSTDGLYYASGALDLPGAMFTASHNPAQYNGIKLCRSGAAPGRPGHRPRRDPRPGAAAPRRRRGPGPSGRRPGAVDERDVLADYAAFLRGLVDLSGSGRSRSSSTPATAWAATPSPPCSARGAGLGPSCRSRSCRSTSSSTARSPTTRPTRSSRRTSSTCRPPSSSTAPTSASPSTATPTAASSSTSDGEPVSPERHHRARRRPRDRPGTRPAATPTTCPIVHNVISSPPSREIVAEARRHAGPHPRRPLVHQGRDGPRQGAVFGGEHSAHYYFRDFWFADTGMLAAMHVLAALGEQDGPLSELVRRVRALRRLRRDQLHGRPTRARPSSRFGEWARSAGRHDRRARRPHRQRHQGDADVVVQPARLQHRAAAAAQRRGRRPCRPWQRVRDERARPHPGTTHR